MKMRMENWWNGTDRGEEKNEEKTPVPVSPCPAQPRSNPGPRGERKAPNRLNHCAPLGNTQHRSRCIRVLLPSPATTNPAAHRQVISVSCASRNLHIVSFPS